jgi:hypothetical protein
LGTLQCFFLPVAIGFSEMNARHKSKTIATALSALVGMLGLHRFYLFGCKDVAGWIYLAASLVYLNIAVHFWSGPSLATRVACLFPLTAFIAAVEALVIGLTEDTKWDQRHNACSLGQSRSGWPLIIVLVLTMATGFTALVASLARATDLLYTGGAFG